jgi:argininosuccinate lyase
VGALVRAVLDRGAGLQDATAGEIAAAGLADIELPELTAQASVDAKRSAGGTGLDAVRTQLDDARREVQTW